MGRVSKGHIAVQEVLAILAVLAIAAFIVLFVIEICFNTSTTEPGRVAGKQHHAAWIQPIVTSNGKSTTTTIVYHPERYTVLVRAESGLHWCDTSKDRWAGLVEGDQVYMATRRGKLLGWMVGRSLVDRVTAERESP